MKYWVTDFEANLSLSKCEIALRLLSLDLTDYKSRMIQLMPDGTKPLPEPKLTQI